MTKLVAVELGEYLDSSRPIIPLALQVTAQLQDGLHSGQENGHSHPRGQLIYAISGVMRVICSRDIWVVPPSQAVWVPPNQEHEVYFAGELSLRNLYVDPSVVVGLPERCSVLKVSSLLKELILKAAEIGDGYQPDSVGWRLMQVLLDELRQAAVTPLHLPMARDVRIMRVIEALLKEPGDSRDLEQWGLIAGASGRTLSRLFVSETGLTFAVWRKRLQLQEAIKRLDEGQQVTRIAFDLGYQSLSAFIEMFRKEMGVSPGCYARQQV